ncbi:MAG: IS66 family insertion sequence element accessory protein TnpB [Gammaproteobacteria bacterium]|nr:IS66 family insertion sequence element accessory protein TnpB [Gammaproteobacteria bacterium]
MMRPPVDGVEVFLYKPPIDMRKSINGLALLVEGVLQHNPFSTHLFVFRNRARDKVKILYWESSGFVLWYKRLEQARFTWPRTDGDVVALSGQQLNWLLDGYDINRLQPHAALPYSSVA